MKNYTTIALLLLIFIISGFSQDNSQSVSDNRYWQCPKCNAILEKKGLGIYWNAGDPISKVGGKATCSNCNSVFKQSDVYSGLYDIFFKAKQERKSDFTGEISMLVFVLSMNKPIEDAEAICFPIVDKLYPKADLVDYYCTSNIGNTLSADEALLLYHAYNKAGNLPDLGTQFDNYSVKDNKGKDIIVLFFK